MARRVDIKAVDTKRLEQESARMEAKLEVLRDIVTKEREAVAEGKMKWRHGGDNKPIVRGYVSHVSTDRPRKPKGKPSAVQLKVDSPAPNAPSGTKRPAPPRKQPTPKDVTACADANDQPARTTYLKSSDARGGVIPTMGHFVPLRKAVETTGEKPKTALGSNLAVALSAQAAKLSEVEAFLSETGLERYFKLFEEHGFDCMESVGCVSEDHLRGMGIPMGHCVKIMKRIQEKNATDKPKHTAGSTQSTPVLEPLSPPGAQGIPGLQRVSKVSFSPDASEKKESAALAGTSGDGEATGSLMDGAFDEAESAASFKEAVAAWRDSSAQKKDSAPTIEVPKEKQAFSWDALGDSTMALHGAGQAETSSSGTVTSPSARQVDERHCCYVCFKQFVQGGIHEHDPILKAEKMMCSEVCREAFLREIKEKQAKLEEREMLHQKLLGHMKLREDILGQNTEPPISRLLS
eukprot:GEMP01037389.1.p1 GENE.GEMP01037389.1~~GEMP01037389.1.p1  ORF type:complete len:463 (+),score=127.94 GEMP01037389.1:109-1497(+)